MHAHPKMIRTGTPVLPPTVVDQIFLWEQERNRFTFSEGVLYSQFMSQSDFDTLRDYAQDLGVLVWQNDRKRTMVSKPIPFTVLSQEKTRPSKLLSYTSVLPERFSFSNLCLF